MDLETYNLLCSKGFLVLDTTSYQRVQKRFSLASAWRPVFGKDETSKRVDVGLGTLFVTPDTIIPFTPPWKPINSNLPVTPIFLAGDLVRELYRCPVPTQVDILMKKIEQRNKVHAE